MNNNDNWFINVLATAMALASSGMVLAGPAVDPAVATVQPGAVLTISGRATVGSYPSPVPANPPASVAAPFLGTFDRPVAEIMPNCALRPVERLMLIDGGIGVDLIALASVLPATAKLTVTGRYAHFFPVIAPQGLSKGSIAAMKILPHGSRTVVDALHVTALTIDGVAVVAPRPDQIARLGKIGERLAHLWIRELNPAQGAGPAAVTEGVQVLTTDLIVVDVEFVNGWTEHPVRGCMAKLLVSIGDDEVTVVSGSLPVKLARN